MYVYCILQGDQLNMAVCFWYLVKSDLSSVHYSTRVHWKSHFLQGSRKTRPCLSGHLVCIGIPQICLLNMQIGTRQSIHILRKPYHNLVFFNDRLFVRILKNTFMFSQWIRKYNLSHIYHYKLNFISNVIYNVSFFPY